MGGYLAANFNGEKLSRGSPDLEDFLSQNKFHPAVNYMPSRPETIHEWQQLLLSHDIMCLERRPHGRDIAAACGQLAKQSGKSDATVYETVHYYSEAVESNHTTEQLKKGEIGVMPVQAGINSHGCS